MKAVQKSVLIWYTPQEMFDLVVDVPSYPAFLPWCERGEVLEQGADLMVARVHLAFAGIHQSFTTRNRHVPGSSVDLELVDGPFSRLEGHWRFHPLGEEGGPKACRIEFSLSYAISNRALAFVIGPVFDRIANTLVDAFVKRAEQVYGPR